MGCNTCGAATHVTYADEPQEHGEFREEYECANGHTGTIRGLEEQLPSQWDKVGEVFA